MEEIRTRKPPPSFGTTLNGIPIDESVTLKSLIKQVEKSRQWKQDDVFDKSEQPKQNNVKRMSIHSTLRNRKKYLHCGKWLKKYVTEYFRETTFHGLRYVGSENGNTGERIIWTVVCVTAFIITCVMSYSAYSRLQGMPTVTSIESIYFPLGTIPFPGVTICNNNKLYKPGFRKLVEEFKSYNYSRSQLVTFFKQLHSLLDADPIGKKKLKLVRSLTEASEKLGYDSDKLMYSLSQPCSELLQKCKWLGKEYNCSKAFVMIKSPKGYCCSFNWHADTESGSNEEDDDPDNPFQDVIYAKTAGSPRQGLSVTLDLEEDNFMHYNETVFGAKILLHDGTDYPEYSLQETFTEPNHHTTVRVEGSIIESTENVRSLSHKLRQCWFDDERSLLSTDEYSFQTCMTEARIKKVTEKCKCIPFYYPKVINMRVCTLLDVECIHEMKEAEVKELESSVDKVKLPCLPQCSDKFYHINAVSSPARSQIKSSLSVLNVFFREVYCVKYRKESLMTWDGLLSVLGGIFGLCLGGSVLSLIEFFYYFTYQIWFRIIKEKSNNSIIRVQPNKKSTTLLVPNLNKTFLPQIFELEYKNVLKTQADVFANKLNDRYYP